MLKFFPLIFVFLWSSAFITGKVIVEDSSPIAALCFRFAIVTFGFFLYSLIAKQKIFHPIAETSKAMATGILFHGIYLGGCWFSLSKGMPAGIVALIVTLQPILTSLASRTFVGRESYMEAVDRNFFRIWRNFISFGNRCFRSISDDCSHRFLCCSISYYCRNLVAKKIKHGDASFSK